MESAQRKNNQPIGYVIVLLLLCICVLGCTDPKRVPFLTRQLSSTNPSLRNSAALELAEIGPPYAESAVPQLIQLLSDENAGVQSSAAFALRKIDTQAARQALEAARRFQK